MSSYPVYNALSPILFPLFQRKIIDITGAEHLPTSGGFLLACNHVDWLDGFYIVAMVSKLRGVRTHFLSQSNNYWWTGITVQIPSDRAAIVDRAVQALREGKVICNFPEGVRNDTARLSPGKTGTVRMAAEAGVPVIPVGITCDSAKSMGQSIRYLISRQHQVQLAFGQPLRFTIPPGGSTSTWLADETTRLMRAIAPLAHKDV